MFGRKKNPYLQSTLPKSMNLFILHSKYSIFPPIWIGTTTYLMLVYVLRLKRIEHVCFITQLQKQIEYTMNFKSVYYPSLSTPCNKNFVTRSS
jgi:hypothetical protein